MDINKSIHANHAVPTSRANQFICMPVLVASLLTNQACMRERVSPPTVYIPQSCSSTSCPYPPVLEDAPHDIKGTKTHGANIDFLEGRHRLKENDSIIRMRFQFDEGGFFEYRVGKIKRNGVEIVMNMEINASDESANSSRVPWRIKYGEESSVFDYYKQTYGMDWFGPDIVIKAEKGTADSVILTISYRDGYAEMKKMANEK